MQYSDILHYGLAYDQLQEQYLLGVKCYVFLCILKQYEVKFLYLSLSDIICFYND